ncbi:MAG: hypothetical protein E7606_02105 [Ruminococcaceae bacterium]|nr:hypothetical protein [Oscillospiraceae bacterium]
MAEFEKIPDPKDKVSEFQRKYNSASKSTARLIGTNAALFVCLLLPILLIGFIWMDFGVPSFGIKYISEGVVTVALFTIGELMMMRLGADGGKLDGEYLDAKKEFKALLDEVNSIGTILLSLFCDWQIDIEMDHAVLTRLRALKFTRADWEKVKDLPKRELKKKYGGRKTRAIMALRKLSPIDLNEAILLFDGAADGFARGGVPISGDEFLHKKTHSINMVLSAIFMGLLTVSVAITLTSDVSWARVLYTMFKVVLLVYRMAVGYNLGAKAYNSIEVRQLQAKSNYLRQYLRFMKEKTYLNLEDKYGTVQCYVGGEKNESVPPSAPTVQAVTEPIPT